jgi:hypothetical protein
MMLNGMRNHPVVKKALEMGEERMGKLASQLLSNERFVAGVQALVTSALSAKGTLDRSLRRALSAMNLPSAEDVRGLEKRIASLEQTVESLGDRLGEVAARTGRKAEVPQA